MTETPNPNIIDADTLTGEMRPIRRAVLALGSNLGERLASLQGAVNALADTPDVWITAVSPVYETDPVDSPEEAGPFLNAVVLADTTLPAARLMERALAIEDAFERERSDVKNAPRTLDVDLIVVGDRRSNEESLQLPHPRAGERAFVMRPWLDVDPEAEAYLNAVVLIDTTLAASRLMDRALAIEDAFERERSVVRNAPRTLDVDLIVVGDRRSDDESLRLPHPRAHERAFVLRPWLDVEPDATLPDRGPVAELLDQADQGGIKVREDLVLEIQ